MRIALVRSVRRSRKRSCEPFWTKTRVPLEQTWPVE